jgi:hypothetical protein
MPWNDKISNSHQIHAYRNLRAAMPGTGPAANPPFGTYEYVPRVSVNHKGNTGFWDQ